MGVKIVHRSKVVPAKNTNIVSPGSYSVTSIESRPWASTNVSSSRPKTRRAKPTPAVINSIFKECAEIVDDPTWKSIFTEAAMGKLPRGFTYKDGYITHKIRNRTARLEVSSIPEVALEECLYFFREKAGIMSQEDQRKAKEEFEEFLLTSGALHPSKWSEIRKKKVKDVLISTFVAKISKELNLQEAQKVDLRNKIYTGFILGCFGNDQVELEKGYIRSIAGLDFNPETKTFYIDYARAPKQTKKSRRVEKTTRPKNSFYTLWVKYLETLEKRVAKTGCVTPPNSVVPKEKNSEHEIITSPPNTDTDTDF